MTALASDSRPRTLGVTLGDPGGVGPEVVMAAVGAATRTGHDDVQFIIIGDRSIAERASKLVGVTDSLSDWDESALSPQPGIFLADTNSMASNEFRPGEISEANGRAAYAYLETSVRLAKAGRVDALVTAPVSKEAIKAAHSHFSDQATYFASAFGLDPESPVTMVVSGRLRCFLVTKHIPLADVSAALNIDRISRVCLLAHSTLRQLGVKEPRLAVASLNPHVGEGGLIGTEEIKIIRPAIESLITKVEIAPTLTTGKAAFELLMEGTADGVIAMYHDQSAPVELLGGVTATVTLGLPIVRTSVGHGTAFDIAWTGTASPAALAMAIDSAITLVRS